MRKTKIVDRAKNRFPNGDKNTALRAKIDKKKIVKMTKWDCAVVEMRLHGIQNEIARYAKIYISSHNLQNARILSKTIIRNYCS